MRIIDADNLKKNWVWGTTDKNGKTKVVELEDIEREITVDLMDEEVSENLGMTLRQMETEIQFMRNFDKWLQANVEDYDWICHQYARYNTENQMRQAGISEEEIKETCDAVEKELSGRCDTNDTM